MQIWSNIIKLLENKIFGKNDKGKNIILYSKKQRWKLLLFIMAIVIGSGSMSYTNVLVKKLSEEERKKLEVWAEATKEVQNVPLDQDISPVIYRILQENKTIPVILVDDNLKIIMSNNLDGFRLQYDREKYLNQQLKLMQEQHEPLVVQYAGGHRNYIYYKDSTILTLLIYFPYIQLSVLFLFVFVSYLAFSSSRKSEQNQVWVGMSKETAHQLGTPISSLVAWVEMLKLKNEDPIMINEVEKDIKRLEMITERFSKIGAAPVLKEANIVEVIENAVKYLRLRTSQRVEYSVSFEPHDAIFAPINVPLFEWVIENLCKNAVDAMNGAGSIDITIEDHIETVVIDVCDSGKGIPKSKFKTVFKPGFTTKSRGWGLGLSLAKRIVEINHSGKIFVKSSELGFGATFRIILNKHVHKTKMQAKSNALF